ncbi:hypothetical protein E2C01_076892 [Portunus trituberculatus]|uniref:Uncharacterized protein n=1 Tax=Portunus trituberculatus TaxID=210409 RepID=A0A5B7IJR5_PORTR|nr:hypothetical protein [Portunus trituberculatus]
MAIGRYFVDRGPASLPNDRLGECNTLGEVLPGYGKRGQGWRRRVPTVQTKGLLERSTTSGHFSSLPFTLTITTTTTTSHSITHHLIQKRAHHDAVSPQPSPSPWTLATRPATATITRVSQVPVTHKLHIPPPLPLPSPRAKSNRNKKGLHTKLSLRGSLRGKEPRVWHLSRTSGEAPSGSPAERASGGAGILETKRVGCLVSVECM